MKGLLLSAAIAAFALPAVTVPSLAQPTPRRSQSDQPDCTAQMGALPTSWDGQAFAIDGHTLGGIGLKPHLRIWGIQAPELRDAANVERVAGMRARATLEDLLERADHKVRCRLARFDRSCRVVAQCSLDDGKGGDLGGALIAAGMAYGLSLNEALPWEPRAGQRYATGEAEARKQRRGLWPEWLGEK
jgi:endonuclease YncB( thermonuclease family)